MLIIPIVLLVLPKSFFDHGQSICLSKLLLHTECPGCGMTRAMMHLIHLDFEGAYNFNKLAFIVFPLLCYVWAREFWDTLNKTPYRKYYPKGRPTSENDN